MLFNWRAQIFTFSGTQVRIAEIERLQSLFMMTMVLAYNNLIENVLPDFFGSFLFVLIFIYFLFFFLFFYFLQCHHLCRYLSLLAHSSDGVFPPITIVTVVVVIAVLRMQCLVSGASLASRDSIGREPVHLASMRNHKEALVFLFENNVTIGSADEAGKLPTHTAAFYGGKPN